MSRAVRVYVHCAECGKTLVVGEEVYSGEAIIVDGLLEDHCCNDREDIAGHHSPPSVPVAATNALPALDEEQR